MVDDQAQQGQQGGSGPKTQDILKQARDKINKQARDKFAQDAEAIYKKIMAHKVTIKQAEDGIELAQDELRKLTTDYEAALVQIDN